MPENYLILAYFSIIIIFQSIIGVGVLVLGTPFLLILKYFFHYTPFTTATRSSNLFVNCNGDAQEIIEMTIN